MMQDEPTLAQVFYWTLLASVGGAAKYFVSSLKTPVRDMRHFITLLLINVFISGFSGLMGALVVSTITTDVQWHLIASGIFGYLGTQGLDIIMLLLQKKIGAGPVPMSNVIAVPPGVDPNAPSSKQ